MCRPIDPKPQPAVAELALRRITRRELARQLGMSTAWISRQLNGYDKPSVRFRAGLSELLELPEEQLFRAEVPS